MMIQLFASKLYLFHMADSTLDLYSIAYVYVCWNGNSRIEILLFSFPLIYHSLPHWPRPRMKLPEVLFQVLHSLCSSCFLVQYLCFPDCGWNYSLPTLCSSKFFKVSVVESAEFVELGGNIGGCFPAALGEAGLCFSALPLSLHSVGMDQAPNPASSTPSGLVRIKRSHIWLQFFPVVLC